MRLTPPIDARVIASMGSLYSNSEIACEPSRLLQGSGSGRELRQSERGEVPAFAGFDYTKLRNRFDEVRVTADVVLEGVAGDAECAQALTADHTGRDAFLPSNAQSHVFGGTHYQAAAQDCGTAMASPRGNSPAAEARSFAGRRCCH